MQAGVGVPSGPLFPQGTVCPGLPQVAPPLGPLLLGTLWPVWLLALPEPLLGRVAWNRSHPDPGRCPAWKPCPHSPAARWTRGAEDPVPLPCAGMARLPAGQLGRWGPAVHRGRVGSWKTHCSCE